MRVRAFAVVAWFVDSRHHAGAEETIKIRTMPGPTSAAHLPCPASPLVRDMLTAYHQQTKNLLVSYSPRKLGFCQRHEKQGTICAEHSQNEIPACRRS